MGTEKELLYNSLGFSTGFLHHLASFNLLLYVSFLFHRGNRVRQSGTAMLSDHRRTVEG